MLNSVLRTSSLMVGLVVGALLGCSIGCSTGSGGEGREGGTGQPDPVEIASEIPHATPCGLRFQDYPTIESLRVLSDEQVFCLRRQMLEAYREERRWALLLNLPRAKMLLPDDSPLLDMPWERAFTDEAKRNLTAVRALTDIVEMDIARDPGNRRDAEYNIFFAARQWDEIVTSRRKLTRDILEKVYGLPPSRSTPDDLNYIYIPPAPK